MDLKRYEGRNVYLEIKAGFKVRCYSGKVVEVDTTNKNGLVWVTIYDKFGKYITFLDSEVVFIQEEDKK